MKNDISPDGRGGTKAAKAFNTVNTEDAETSGVESEVFTSHQSLVTSHRLLVTVSSPHCR